MLVILARKGVFEYHISYGRSLFRHICFFMTASHCSDEGLTLETSAFKLLTVADIYVFNSVVNSELPSS